MNSQERIVTALNHEAPDRLPIDLGGSAVSSIALSTYAALRDHLKLSRVPIRTLETVQQIAVVDDDVLDLFGVDVIPVFANPPAGYTPQFEDEADGGSSFKDEFGATLRRFKSCFYYDWQEFPLPEPSIDLMWKMPWPDPADPARYRGLRERVLQLRRTTDRALFGMAPCGHDLFNQLLRVRGMAEGLMDLVAEPEFAEAFLDRLTDIINPVQVSAAGMDTAQLKKKYGKHLTFWGGGCDTQKVLPYGTTAEVRCEVQKRIRDLAPGGGFVLNPVHNIQPLVPVENVVTMFQTAKEWRY